MAENWLTARRGGVGRVWQPDERGMQGWVREAMKNLTQPLWSLSGGSKLAGGLSSDD